ncbi:hypothetical protein F5X96DRAFT_408744 [Biscogniauxia mediterranea]|nr:hypothetical protein F5X96DRAFT_408744 [Biscogniauxia mediterranea]
MYVTGTLTYLRYGMYEGYIPCNAAAAIVGRPSAQCGYGVMAINLGFVVAHLWRVLYMGICLAVSTRTLVARGVYPGVDRYGMG